MSSVLRKGAWTTQEDMLLKNCIEKFGEGKWHLVPLRAGLNRCRKSCRLRWLNYLRPNIKRGDFTEDEVDLMLRLHKLLGNRWALIAGRLPGRTANDVKNYWNTNVKPRSKQQKGHHEVVEPTKHTMVTVIKPQPHTISKDFNLRPHITTRDTHNLVASSSINDINNAFNISPGVVVSSKLSIDKINEYLEELFDDQEMEIDNEVGWCFGGLSAVGDRVEVVNQVGGPDNLFDFPIEDVGMMGLLDREI